MKQLISDAFDAWETGLDLILNTTPGRITFTVIFIIAIILDLYADYMIIYGG